jgi:hypothetical protein
MYRDQMRIFIGFCVVLAAACGGGKSAEDKCNDILDTLCDRIVECFSPPPTHAECVAQISPSLPCASAKKVGSTYDSCINHLEDDSCGVLFPPDQNGDPTLELPSDCNGVIMARQAPVPNSSPLYDEAELLVSPI